MKRFRNKFAFWTAIIYLLLVLIFGAFSVGNVFLASSDINGLFFTAVIPAILIALIINFFVGYGLGLLLEKVWRKLK